MGTSVPLGMADLSTLRTEKRAGSMVAGSIARSSIWGRRIVAAAELARLMRMVDGFIFF